MNITVIGCGYLGAVHACAMAELGHHVVGVDVDRDKIEALSEGRAPFHEPGFTEILRRRLETGGLTFTTDFSAIAGARVHFIAVGTPQGPGGAADLTYVEGAIEAMKPYLGKCLNGDEVVVGKSTVPVGTAARLAPSVAAAGTLLVWNPEFLREGFAVEDTLQPDRMVYGLPVDSDDAERAKAVLDELYAPIIESGTPRLVMDYATAELVKISANAFLATKISFINAMASVCDAAGGDVTALARAIGMDARIGSRFLRAGIGFGGGCLPKDIRAFRARADELGVGEALNFLAEVDQINENARHQALDKARSMLGGSVSRARVAVLGTAFKPDSDDMRCSPGLALATELADEGAHVVVTDPAAAPILAHDDDLPYDVAADLEEALTAADLVLLATEWDQYTRCDPSWVADLVSRRNVVDGRNALDPEAWRSAGFAYAAVGSR